MGTWEELVLTQRTIERRNREINSLTVWQKQKRRTTIETRAAVKNLRGRNSVKFIGAVSHSRLYQPSPKAWKEKLDSCLPFPPLHPSWAWAFISAGHVWTCPAPVFRSVDRHGFLSQVSERGCVQGHGQLNPVHRLNAVAYLPDLISMNKLDRRFPLLRVGTGSWRSALFLAIQIRLRGATLRSRSKKLVLNVQKFWRSVSWIPA